MTGDAAGPAVVPPASTRRGADVLVALGLATGPAVALGLARFAYALLLPSMQSALHWSFATAGAMNTANAAGYLGGALLAAPVIHRWGARPVFLAGMAATAVLLLASAASGSVVILVALRTLVGAAGAATFIVGGSLAAPLGRSSPPTRSALLLGVYFGGGGLGVAVSGAVLPAVLAATDPASGWRWGWVALGVATALAFVAALVATRRTPQPPPHRAGAGSALRAVIPLLLGYSAFGAGYIAYMTFVVAYLADGGAGTVEIAVFWAVLGVAAMAGGFVWAPLLHRLRGGRAPALLIAVVAAGALLPLLSRAVPVSFASAALFGISFLAVVTAVTHVARTTLEPPLWTAAIATLTTGFALGQCIGPIASGVLADRTDGVRAGLLLSVAILLVGAVTCLAQRAGR